MSLEWMENVSPALSRYVIEGGHQDVSGWLGDGEINLTLHFDYVQKQLGVAGDVAEIGVHEGRFLILLSLLRREGEKGFAIDLFESQDLNVDRSGAGCLRKFHENVRRFCPEADSVISLKVDSLSIQASGLDLLTKGSRFRLFSVDGGHTPVHVTHDLALAEATLAPGGVILLDGVFNRHWPGVFEGLARYMLQGPPPTLVPVVSAGNKLCLVSLSYQQKYQQAFEQMESWKITKRTTMFGWPVLVS